MKPGSRCKPEKGQWKLQEELRGQSQTVRHKSRQILFPKEHKGRVVWGLRMFFCIHHLLPSPLAQKVSWGWHQGPSGSQDHILPLPRVHVWLSECCKFMRLWPGYKQRPWDFKFCRIFSESDYFLRGPHSVDFGVRQAQRQSRLCHWLCRLWANGVSFLYFSFFICKVGLWDFNGRMHCKHLAYSLAYSKDFISIIITVISIILLAWLSIVWVLAAENICEWEDDKYQAVWSWKKLQPLVSNDQHQPWDLGHYWLPLLSATGKVPHSTQPPAQALQVLTGERSIFL